MTFSIAVARTDQADNILEREFVMAMAMGPAFVRGKKATGTMRFYVNLGLASWKIEANPFKLFHHRFAPKRKWNSVND